MIQRANLADQVARDLAGRLLRGAFAGGTLPTLRAVARDYRVTLPTAQRAVARLEGLGIVDVRHGSGIRPRPAAGLAALPIWIEASLADPAAAARLLGDFLELRRVVASAALPRARGRLDAAASARLESLAREMETTRDLRRLAEIDLAIAGALVGRSGQSAFVAVFQSFERLLLDSPEVQAAMYAEPRRNAAGYRALFALLRSRATPAGVRGLVDAALAEADRGTLRRFRSLLRRRKEIS